MKEIKEIKENISALAADMESFCGIYAKNESIWQGEAAIEEACYITSDIEEFRNTIAEIEIELNELTANKSGAEK